MKKKNIIAALALTLSLGLGATVYAAATTTTTSTSPANTNSTKTTCEGVGFRRITGLRGYDYVVSVLKDKLKLTDKEINDAINSGKTPYNLAIEKGLTADEFKNAMLDQKIKAIDDAVSKGSITKEEGERIKNTIKTNIQNCDGTGCGNSMGGQGRGRGMNGNGMRGMQQGKNLK